MKIIFVAIMVMDISFFKYFPSPRNQNYKKYTNKENQLKQE